MSKKYIIGLMSGTSVDGIDAALVRIEGSYTDTVVEEIAFDNYSYPKEVRDRIFKLFEIESSNSRDICDMNFVLGELFGQAAIDVAKKGKIGIEQVELIGSHGQTIYHMPETFSTLQIGEGAVIAHKTGVTTVSDFRTADMAAGGLGAPLVPYTEFLLYGGAAGPFGGESIALQNIGGIGNITVIPKKADPDSIVAFDTGPGNMIIDYLVQKIYSISFDRNGDIASKGFVNQKMLDYFMDDEYIKRKPPKTTGREYFGRDYSEKFYAKCKDKEMADADIIATATAFTAATIGYSIDNFIDIPVENLVVGGGGAYNTSLFKMISDFLPTVSVTTQEACGYSSDAKEAIAFAVLANETMVGNPGNLPSVTGASRRKILGKINMP